MPATSPSPPMQLDKPIGEFEANSRRALEHVISSDRDEPPTGYIDRLERDFELSRIKSAETLWNRIAGNHRPDEKMLATQVRVTTHEWYPGLDQLKKQNLDVEQKRRVLLLKRHLDFDGIELNPNVAELKRTISIGIAAARRFSGRGPGIGKLTAIVRGSRDRSERRFAWETIARICNRISTPARSLGEFRNALAKKAGYNGYLELLCECNEIRRDHLASMLERFLEETECQFQDSLRKGQSALGIRSIRPWDIDYLFENQCPDPGEEIFPAEYSERSLHETLDSLGFRTSKLQFTICYQPIESNGFCVFVRIPSDIRVVLKPTSGETLYSTLYHECGHALHYSNIRQRPASFKYLEAECFAEGMAYVLLGIMQLPEWLAKHSQFPEGKVSEFIKERKTWLTFQLRNYAARSLFEMRYYQDPPKDLAETWHDLCARHLSIEKPTTRNWPSISVATMPPFSFANSIIGHAIANQTLDYLRRRYSKLIPNHEISNFLISNLYSPGASRSWMDKLQSFLERPTLDRMVAGLAQELEI